MVTQTVHVWGPDHGPDLRDAALERAILGSLPRGSYRRGFHAACGSGWLTARLAEVCLRLSAVDPHPQRVLEACAATSDLPGVDLAIGDPVSAWPAGRFDLIVLVDILTRLSPAAVTTALHTAALSARPGATLVVAHTARERSDDLWTVPDVHDRVRADVRWIPSSARAEEGLTLEVLTRR